MAITKIQAGALPADVITTAAIDDASITHAKLHTTMDLSSKTVTLPTLSTLNTTGNVGIGTDTPNSYSNQTTLTINGATYGRLDLEQSGSLKASLFATTGSATLLTTTNILSFDTSGGEAMRIDGSGNIGIGVAEGDVTGDGTASRTYVSIIGSGNRGRLNLGSTAANGADSGVITFVNGTNELGSINMDTNSGVQNAGKLYITSSDDITVRSISDITYQTTYTNSTAGHHIFKSYNTEIMRMDGGNNRVGIGETSPLGKLHVKTADSGATADASADELVIEGSGNTGISILSGASNAGSIYFGDSGTNWDGYIAYSQSSRSMTLGTAAGGGSVNIDSSGNVGIAKSSLNTWSSGYNALQVGGRGFVGAHSSSDLYLGQNASFNSGWKYEDSVAASMTQHSGGKITHFVAPAGTAGNAVSWNTAMDINPSGYVTTPINPAFHSYGTGMSNQTVVGVHGTWNQIHDKGNNFTPGTNATFTAPVAGVYAFYAQANFNNNSSTPFYWRFKVNGSLNGIFYSDSTADTWTHIMAFMTIDLSANDYVQIAYKGDPDEGGDWCHFGGYLIG
jgi:hypothetical protein